jgi:rhodanese-related sulfurtransferase
VLRHTRALWVPLAWRGLGLFLRRRFPTVTSLSSARLAAWLDGAPRPLLLDARTDEEYAVSHLPGATRIDPDASPGSLTAQVTALRGLDGARPVVIYCSVGYRSARAAARLQRAGFGGVYNLDGSIFRWAAEGRPVVRDGERVREVHPYNAAWGLLLPRRLRAE